MSEYVIADIRTVLLRDLDGEIIERDEMVIAVDPPGEDDDAVAVVHCEPSEDREPYDRALAAAGWVVTGRNNLGRDIVARTTT